MIAWMLYAVLVALALATAAFMAERAAKGRGTPTRWLWVASMLGSLVVPIVIACASIQLPGSFAEGRTAGSLVLSDATSIQTPLTQIHLDDVPVYGLSISVDDVAVDLWVSSLTPNTSCRTTTAGARSTFGYAMYAENSPASVLTVMVLFTGRYS